MTYVMTESEAKELKNMTAAQLFDILGDHPYPGATNLSGGAMGFMCFQVDGLWIAYDKGMWNVEQHETQYPITPNFPPFGELTVRDVHAEISRVVKIGKSLHANTQAVATETNTTPSWEETKADCVGPDLPTEQTFVSTDRYRELEAELVKMTAERDDLSVRVKQKTDVIKAQAAQIQQHSDGWEQTEAQLEAMTTERDEARKNYLALINNNPLSPTINTIAEKLGVCPAEPGPMFEAIDRLKSKAGLLSVVCRRLCGDENATAETVHKALDSMDVCITNLAASHEQVDKYRVVFKQVEKIRLELMSALDDYNSPTHYGNHPEGKRLGTVERVRIGLLVLWSKWNEAQQKVNQLEGKVDQLTMLDLYFAHKTLDTLNAPRLAGGHELDLSARIRSLFTRKV